MKQFGENLKRIRESFPLSRKELAQAIDATQQSIGLYENGKRAPSLDVLRKLASTLNVTTDELLGHDLNKYRENIRYATINGFPTRGEADGGFTVKVSPMLSSAIEFYSKGKIPPSKSNNNIRLSEQDFYEWIALTKARFEARKDIESVLQKLRREELEQTLGDIIRNRYAATDGGNS